MGETCPECGKRFSDGAFRLVAEVCAPPTTEANGIIYPMHFPVLILWQCGCKAVFVSDMKI